MPTFVIGDCCASQFNDGGQYVWGQHDIHCLADFWGSHEFWRGVRNITKQFRQLLNKALCIPALFAPVKCVFHYGESSADRTALH